jgi:hypothetical protein
MSGALTQNDTDQFRGAHPMNDTLNSLLVYEATEEDAARFTPLSVTPLHGLSTDNHVMAEAVRQSIMSLLVTDTEGVPLMLLGCIKHPDGNGFPWFELSPAAVPYEQEVTHILRGVVKHTLLHHHPVLFGAVPAEDKRKRAMVESIGFTAMEPTQDAAGRPAFVPYFMRSTERMHAEA